MENTTKKLQKVAQEFYCEKCDYLCCKKSSFEKHLLTKNIIQQNTTKYNKTIIHVNVEKHINTELLFTITKRLVKKVAKSCSLMNLHIMK